MGSKENELEGKAQNFVPTDKCNEVNTGSNTVRLITEMDTRKYEPLIGIVEGNYKEVQKHLDGEYRFGCI